MFPFSLRHIIAEIKETEQTYVQNLDNCVQFYLNEMTSPNVPDTLKGKEMVIFGSILSLRDFHKNVFLKALESNGKTVEGIGQCFVDYVSYKQATYFFLCLLFTTIILLVD